MVDYTCVETARYRVNPRYIEVVGEGKIRILGETFKTVGDRGVMVSMAGQFFRNGHLITPKMRINDIGCKLTPYINLSTGGHKKSYMCARMVAEAWLKGYTPDCRLGYRDGDNQNFCVTNLYIMHDYEWRERLRKQAESNFKEANSRQGIIEATRKKAYEINLAADTVDKADFSEFNEYVESKLMPELIKYAKQRGYGNDTATRVVTMAISNIYDKMFYGHIVGQPSKVARKMIREYRKGREWGIMQHYEETKLIIKHLNINSLCEKFKVTKHH